MVANGETLPIEKALTITFALHKMVITKMEPQYLQLHFLLIPTIRPLNNIILGLQTLRQLQYSIDAKADYLTIHGIKWKLDPFHLVKMTKFQELPYDESIKTFKQIPLNTVTQELADEDDEQDSYPLLVMPPEDVPLLLMSHTQDILGVKSSPTTSTPQATFNFKGVSLQSKLRPVIIKLITTIFPGGK